MPIVLLPMEVRYQSDLAFVAEAAERPQQERAQVFRIAPLANAIKDALTRLGLSRLARSNSVRAISQLEKWFLSA